MEKLQVAWMVFGLYGLVTAFLAFRGMRKTQTLAGFALGNGDLGPWLTGVTLAAAIASTATFVINPGFVYAHGISALMHLGIASFAGVIFGLVLFSKGFRKHGMESRALTLPHWVENRFGSRGMRTYFALLNLILAITFVVLIVKGSALVMQHTLGTGYIASLAIIVLFVFSYILIGGTYAHVYTNALQGGIMVVVALAIVYSGLHLLGDGPGPFLDRIAAQDPNLVALVNPASSLFDSVWGVFVCGFVVGVGLIAQPHILTKSLYLENDKQVNRYLVIGSVVCVIYAGVLLAGLYARVEYPDIATQDAVMPIYLAKSFSPLLSVLVSVALLAAGMSTLDGILVSASTIAANDIFLGALGDRLLEGKSREDREALAFKASRIIIVVMGVIAFALALNPPKLVGIFAQVGIYGLVVASIVPITIGILTETKNRAEVFAASILGPLVHFVYYGVVVYGWGQTLNPAISATAGILAAFSLLGLFALARRVRSVEPTIVRRSVSSLLILAGLSWSVSARAASTYEEVAGFGDNPGNLRMYRYVPDAVPANAPLVVVLHTCSQDASDARRAGWEALADQWKFHVVYPEQKLTNNALGCFNWAGDLSGDDNLHRGRGENQSIIDMIEQMKQDYSIDASRVFVSGQSAGGAQAALMLALYPDVFAAGAILSGIPYLCSNSVTTQAFCLSPGVDHTPAEWGDFVRNAYTFAGPRPRVSIWQGSSDFTVDPMNQAELVEQWTNVLGIDATPDATDTVDGAGYEAYENGSGQTLVESYTVDAGHGTFVNPDQGCGESGTYFIDADICSTSRIAEFFGLDQPPSTDDVQAPVVDIASPSNGQTVSGTVAIEVAASDNFGVSSVELFIDGVLRETLVAAPFTFAWNTSVEANGEHALKAVAHDAAGNSSFDADTTVTVTGGLDDQAPPVVRITSHTEGAVIAGRVTVVVEATDDTGVKSVDLLLGGYKILGRTSPPWEFPIDTAIIPEGEYALSAKAIDLANREGFAPEINVTIAPPVDTLPPTTYVRSPADGTKVEGVVTVEIVAVDDLSGVAKVELSVGGQLVGSDDTAPYGIDWDTSGFADGTYALSVRAVDAAGNESVNEDTKVQIGEATEAPPPTGDEPTPPAEEGSWGCTQVREPAGDHETLGFGLLLGLLAFRRRGRAPSAHKE